VPSEFLAVGGPVLAHELENILGIRFLVEDTEVEGAIFLSAFIELEDDLIVFDGVSSFKLFTRSLKINLSVDHKLVEIDISWLNSSFDEHSTVLDISACQIVITVAVNIGPGNFLILSFLGFFIPNVFSHLKVSMRDRDLSHIHFQ
jgi:hypothetical protein